MPTHVGWLLPNRILYSQSIGVIDEPIVMAHADYLLELLNDGNQNTVYLIFDTLQTTQFKVNLATLKQSTSRYLSHPRVVYSIDVTTHVKNQMLGNVVSSLAKVQWIHLQTLDAALTHFSGLDETLGTLTVELFEQFVPSRTIDASTNP